MWTLHWIGGNFSVKELINLVGGGEKEERIFAEKHNLFFVIFPQCIALVINSDDEGHF